MNTVKYKAWTDEGMISVRRITFAGDIAYVVSDNDEHDGYGFQIDIKNLRQFTGLTDRQGVEIYEGDLVEVTQGNYKWRYKIVWNDYFCEIEAKTYWRNFYNDDDGNYVFEDTFTDEGEANLPSASKGEVIGNIYENSDLLAPKHNQASQLAEGV